MVPAWKSCFSGNALETDSLRLLFKTSTFAGIANFISVIYMISCVTSNSRLTVFAESSGDFL